MEPVFPAGVEFGMRIGRILGLTLGLCACGPRADPGREVHAALSRADTRSIVASSLPDADSSSVEPGFVAGVRYDHAAIPRLQPLSTTDARAGEILKGKPVRRLDFEGGLYSLLWSYAAIDRGGSGATGTGSLVQSGVEVLFDPSGRMVQVLGSTREDAWPDGEWSPSYDLPEELRPTSIGSRVRLENLHAARVTWLARHGGALIAGRAYDHARAPQLVRGTTTAAEARELLAGEPVQRDDYDDGSVELTWLYSTQRLTTSLCLRFGPDGILRAVVNSSPEFLAFSANASPDAGVEGEAPSARRHLRTIDIMQPR
jgi:hypothetical protein